MTNSQALVTVGSRPMLATKANIATMERFIQVMDPRGDPKQRWALAVVAVRLGLHPLNNEVMLYEGQPFITIHGRRRLAERNGDLAAIQPDIITDPQRRRALGARSEGDIVAECRVFRKTDERPTIEYAIVRTHERWPSDKEADALGIARAELDKLRANDTPDGIFGKITHPQAKVRPIIMFPELMAMKRAEARALDSLAFVPLPTYDPDVGAQIGAGSIPAYMLQEDPDPEAPTADAPPVPGPAPPPSESAATPTASPEPEPTPTSRASPSAKPSPTTEPTATPSPPATPTATASTPPSSAPAPGEPRPDPYPGIPDEQLSLAQLYRRIAAKEGRPDPGEPGEGE